jgi:hypothetical protein
MQANLIRRKDAIARRARTGKVLVEFTKADGSVRELIGTLNKKVVPATDRSRTPSEEVLVLFDLEKSQWRSFRIDSVTSYKRLA